jgi:hypothetical protein
MHFFTGAKAFLCPGYEPGMVKEEIEEAIPYTSLLVFSFFETK